MTPGRALTEHVRLPPVIQALLQVTAPGSWSYMSREKGTVYRHDYYWVTCGYSTHGLDDDADGAWVLNAIRFCLHRTAPHRMMVLQGMVNHLHRWDKLLVAQSIFTRCRYER